jgi:isoamylase
MRTRLGSSSPLGATWDGAGVNFALFSENASGVELCLFDDEHESETRIPVTENTDQVWPVIFTFSGHGARVNACIAGRRR